MSHRLAVRAALFFACASATAACEQGRTRSPAGTADDGGKSGGALTAGAGGAGGSAATSGTGGTTAADSGASSVRDAAPGSDSRPDASANPPLPVDAARPVDLAPDKPAVITFQDVSDLLQQSCAGCHEPADTQHVDLTAKGLYARIVGKAPTRGVAACKTMILIKPGDLKGSLIYQKIIKGGTLGQCGKRMPNGCEPDDCLLDEEIKLIGDWITAGAKM
jgi:hypothetical protein